MAALTEKLRAELLSVFTQAIGGDVVYGVRYCFIDESRVREARDIYDQVIGCGYADGEICSLAYAGSGAVMVLSVPFLQHLMIAAAQRFIGDVPNAAQDANEAILLAHQAIAADKGRLTELVIANTRAGNAAIDAVLFGVTPEPSVSFKVKLPDGNIAVLTYPSFNLAHTDIENLNAVYLVPRGYRINRVELLDFAPRGNGVQTRLWCERL